MNSKHEHNESVKRAYTLLRECPDWTLITNYTNRGEGWDQELRRAREMQAEVTECLKELSQFDVGTIRSAVSDFIVEGEGLLKLHPVNRYLFHIPSARSVEAGITIPPWMSTNDPLWPLSLGDDGELQLTGWFRGYYGPSTDYLQQFDEFYRLYGLRRSG